MDKTASIERLVEDGIVDQIVQRVKTGKEAEVFVVRKGEQFFAAKVYKERTQRNFRNNVGYMEGRATRNSRDMRAMAKRTKYGVDKAEAEWMSAEHDALLTAADAGIRVPRPELFYEGVLLMDLVLGTDGQPAPRLSELSFTRDEALAHHREVVGFAIKLLCKDLIHGDLSPFNVLLAWNGPTIIDLPQVVKATHNSQSEQFLVRDVRNVTQFFAKFAPELTKRIDDGYQVWRAYMKRELTPEYFPIEGVVVPAHERMNSHQGVGAGGRRGQPHRGTAAMNADRDAENRARPGGPRKEFNHADRANKDRPPRPNAPATTPASTAPAAPSNAPAATSNATASHAPIPQRREFHNPGRPQGARPPQGRPPPNRQPPPGRPQHTPRESRPHQASHAARHATPAPAAAPSTSNTPQAPSGAGQRHSHGRRRR